MVAGGKHRNPIQDADDGSVLDVSTGYRTQHSTSQSLGQRDLGQAAIGPETIERYKGGAGLFFFAGGPDLFDGEAERPSATSLRAAAISAHEKLSNSKERFQMRMYSGRVTYRRFV